MTLEHRIDLSSIPPLPGRSTDLEAKRKRLWQSLAEDERKGAIEAYARPIAGWELPCTEAGPAYERALYVLTVTGARLTPGQIAYVLLARWHRNTDAGTVRARLATMVRRGHARWTRDGHFYATEEGIGHMRGVEAAWVARERAMTRRGIIADPLQR
jgi:hypothetical protein